MEPMNCGGDWFGCWKLGKVDCRRLEAAEWVWVDVSGAAKSWYEFKMASTLVDREGCVRGRKFSSNATFAWAADGICAGEDDSFANVRVQQTEAMVSVKMELLWLTPMIFLQGLGRLAGGSSKERC